MECRKCATNILDIARSLPKFYPMLEFHTNYPPMTDNAKEVAWEQVSAYASMVSSRLGEAIEACEFQKTRIPSIKLKLDEARREGSIPKVKASIEDLLDDLANALGGH